MSTRKRPELGRAIARAVGYCIFFGLVQFGQAQVTTATFYGIVTDSTGAVIPGATVTLTHDATSTAVTKTTDDAGEFQFDFLRVGSYRLAIGAQGFKNFESSGIQLVSGQRVRQTFALEVGAVTETVEVVGQTPLVNTVSAEQRETLDTRQISELPLSRRSFHNVLNVGTGVTTGSNGAVRLNGLGRSGLRVTVDGTDATSNPENPGTSMYQNFNYIHTMSIEAIQEVQVTKGVVPAEFGHQLGGNVNLISRSGTNEFHGSLFEGFRAENLNAKERRLATKPPFTFNQFGGSIGGPILRDKIFFFTTYEGYRESSFGTVQGDVPTERLRGEAIAAVPAYKIFLDTLRLPNQPHAADADTARFLGASPQARRDNHVVAKGDIRMGSTSSLALTYTRGRPFRLSPEGRTQIGNDREWAGIQERGTASYVTAGAAWSSETRFGFNLNDVARIDQFWHDSLAGAEPFVGGGRLPSIAVDGLFGNGGGAEIVNYFGPVWSVEQKYARHVGQHSMKIGGIVSRRGPSRANIENPRLTYANKADFLANIPRAITATFGVNEYTGRSNEFGLFVQDDWRVRPNLVINLGIRYDYFSNFVAKPTDEAAPAGLYNLDGLLDDQFTFGPFRDPENPFESDAGINLSPRVGFSYNPGSNGKTVIRGGLGVMFSPQPWDDYNNAVANSTTVPFRVGLGRTEALQYGFGYPVTNADVLAVVQQQTGRIFVSDVFDPEIQAPYSTNLYFGVQRSLTPNLVLESAFVGNRGVKFRMSRLFNPPDRVTDARPNPNLGQGNYFCGCQNTVYTSWQTSLRQRYSKNLTFDAHYTWGKALSYTGGDTGAGFSGDSNNNVQDFFNWRANRGPSAGDTTHRFVADWVYDLPWLLNAPNGFVRLAFSGWQVSGILLAQTGESITITQSGTPPSRPDYIGGNAIREDYNRDAIYINADAFQRVPLGAGRNPIRPGTIGNGAIRGPGFWNVDFSFAKNFAITERTRFQFRADMFNLFNYTPYQGFTNSINSANFGRFTSHRGAREVQLNARLTW